MTYYLKKTLRFNTILFSTALLLSIAVLSGCTDKMVGPENAAMSERVVDATDDPALGEGHLAGTFDNDNVRTRVTHRFIVPDTTMVPPLPPPPPPPVQSRVTNRFFIPDTTMVPPPPPPPPPIQSRVTNRYRPPAPDTTQTSLPSSPGNPNGGTGSGNGGS